MHTEFNFVEAKVFLGTLAMTQPRILTAMLFLPMFNRQFLPGPLRYAVGACLGLIVVPQLAPQYAALDIDWPRLLALLAKEAMVGMFLGWLAALPFWIFEAIGFVIDNQRGASLGAILNPATGNDSSPMGILFNLGFMVFFLTAGGFGLFATMLYDSFGLWNIWAWWPSMPAQGAVRMLDQFSGFAARVLLLASPAIVAMFLAELGLALISRFAPQLQVFFLALPVKSALVLFVLVLYMATLFQYAGEILGSVGRIVPFLHSAWPGP
ncbi:type III secretion protein [Bordetella pertussis]|uniref:Type III secretion protein n=4 Tax=Bordetella pertussis TaxID=520 RepID=Q79GR5_BORPE|nr:SctT family type III secretion system export apparatus subunit BscT [Bordetella pertussis]ETH38980.1 type III secretion apparatus protein SpaR/YscT/HrcT [Bordetella pertussis H918]ETH44846.1 type III secretion apparatus protein SpaR/YscT/HrcT [Bordetella pertussis H939]ETH48318.1 type III secretion apparatus protein SpaR/YscT/HrcT [Bordetella pertussis H921]ETH71293.1 type III secretion apparatus protein SpaR/YscT/HrcT [Bordetella pertussis STO1-CHLA-0011]ETH84114.1 type III secretion appar